MIVQRLQICFNVCETEVWHKSGFVMRVSLGKSVNIDKFEISKVLKLYLGD